MQKLEKLKPQQRDHMFDEPLARTAAIIADGLSCIFVAGVGAAVGYLMCHVR